MNILLQDVYSTANRGRLYGEKYSTVMVVSDHSGTLIVEGKTGRFSVCCNKMLNVPDKHASEISREIVKLRHLQDHKITPVQSRLIEKQEQVIRQKIAFIQNTYQISNQLKF